MGGEEPLTIAFFRRSHFSDGRLNFLYRLTKPETTSFPPAVLAILILQYYPIDSHWLCCALPGSDRPIPEHLFSVPGLVSVCWQSTPSTETSLLDFQITLELTLML